MSIYKDDQGRFYFSVRYKGKQYKKLKYKGEYMLTKKEAKVREAQFLLDLEAAEKKKEKQRITLYTLFDEFMANTRASLKASTLASYSKFKKMYLIYIDDKEISEVTISDIANFKNKLGSLPLSNTYKNKQQGVLLNLLKYGSMLYNMPANIQLPLLEAYKTSEIKDFETKTKYIPPADFEALIDPLREDYKNNLYYLTVLVLIYYTGIRIGEASALNVDDYHDRYIFINKDFYRINGQNIIQTPKTENSVRKIKLDSKTASLLDLYIERYKPYGVLFHLNGEYLNQQKLRRIIKNLANDPRFEKYEISPHTLRHSHASYLRELGYDELMISKRLGNTPKVAIETYMHAQDEQIDAIADKLRKEDDF